MVTIQKKRWAPQLDASGAAIAWFGNNTDIGDRQQREQVLRASMHLLQRQVEVLQGSQDALAGESERHYVQDRCSRPRTKCEPG